MDAGREDVGPLGEDPASIAMDEDLSQLLRPHTQETESRADLITCSLCLRVLQDSQWMEAEQVIRAIRSYELPAPPRLQPAVCDSCAESIVSRRAQAGVQPVAA